MRTKRCCAVSIAASACGLQPDARHLDAASMDSCFGSELKLADAPEQTICEPDFVPGQPHLQDKFCKTCCLQGFAVNSSCIRVLSSHARSAYKNSTREGFWNSTHACPPFRVVNQHMRCVGPVLILFTEDPGASEDWSPLPEGMVTDGGVVWFRVAYGTLIPLVRREKGSGDSRARGVLADADLSCTEPPPPPSPPPPPPPPPRPRPPATSAPAPGRALAPALALAPARALPRPPPP